MVMKKYKCFVCKETIEVLGNPVSVKCSQCGYEMTPVEKRKRASVIIPK
jgi:DNA-directed RNA polymerase subunit RPC12/RpoP